VLEKHIEIEKSYVFGSRAKGNYRKNSDINLAIFGNLSCSFAEEIANELYELPLPYKFDVQAY
jgi:predicted nucleotidyltransferase